jgi:hypothetical protein
MVRSSLVHMSTKGRRCVWTIDVVQGVWVREA